MISVDNIDEEEAIEEERISFSVGQLQYLRDEFERQRNWVNLLSTREQKVLSELERTKGSVSYRIGRFLTYTPRRILKALRSNHQRQHSVYVADEEMEGKTDLFPSGIVISPDLLPTDSKMRKGDYLAEDFLIALRQGPLSVNDARDLALEGSFSMTGIELSSASHKIMQHLLNSTEDESMIRNVFIGLLRALVRRKGGNPAEFGETYIGTLFDERAARTLIQVHGKAGNFSKPLALLKRLPKSSWKRQQTQRFKTGAKLVNEPLTLRSINSTPIQSKEGVVMYHASQSRPHTTSGYAIRTHGLVSALKQKGLDIQVNLRHGYPLDRTDFSHSEIDAVSVIDGIEYIFSPSVRKYQLINYQDVYNFNQLEEYLHAATLALMNQAEKARPMLIHSASNFVVGLAGARAAKALGIPSVYEIRGFWHLTQATKREGYEHSDHFNLSERMEIEAAKSSDHVFTITKALKDILVAQGVEASKINVLPNAVSTDKFHAQEKDQHLAQRLKLENRIVIGYIGSFVEYEGLDLLLEAGAMLRNKLGDVFHLLLVGDGDMMIPLRRKARFLQIEDITTFTGRIPHDEVQRYYSLIDIAPLPRKGYKVCELVSPLKPFEAMRAGKVVVCSSVAALAEIVEHEVTGVVFEKDNADDLATKLEPLLLDESLRRTISDNARDWVTEHHSWETVSQRVVDVYERMCEGTS